MSESKSGMNQLSLASCIIVLVVAFLGWAFAGVHMAITSLVMRVATVDLTEEMFRQQGITDDSDAEIDPAVVRAFDNDGDSQLNSGERAKAREATIGQWFSWLVCAFLFGAATGGYVFGFVGDRFGRAKAMALSIFCYSIFSMMTYFVQSPTQLLVLRFLTCMGIGGMWPNAVALVSEAWPNISRPFLAGAIGTAANVGILLFSILTVLKHVELTDWRWTMLVGASPLILGFVALIFVPESPSWLASRSQADKPEASTDKVGLMEIFQPPIRQLTIIGILLGTIPLFGGWGVSNWATAWASEAGDVKVKKDEPKEETTDNAESKDVQPAKKPDPTLKSKASIARSATGSISSLLGAAVASLLGRRLSYGILCVCAFACTQFLFRIDDPASDVAMFSFMGWEPSEFLFWMAALGFFSGFFFGWLPLCLPELFPTRVRSTGAGVSFNWGRILTGIGVLLSGALLKQAFQGRYADVGIYTGFIYVVGIAVIFFMPTNKSELD